MQGLYLLVLIGILLLIGEIILPFIAAIFIAYLLNPLILSIQKKTRNRSLAVTSFLLLSTLMLFGIIFFFGEHLVKDSQRFINAVTTFQVEHEEQIKDTKEKIVQFGFTIKESDAFKEQMIGLDTMSIESQDLITTLKSVYTYFSDSSEIKEVPKFKRWSSLYMILYTLVYLVCILFTYQYFEEKYIKYIDRKKLLSSKLIAIWKEYKIVFVEYFQQRGKIVLINMVLFITTFSIIGLPGAIIIGIIAGVLTYASQFHYLSLPLVGIGCWVLSIENGISFLAYFSILLAVYILVSILEETIYFNKIMKSVNGMNSAITILAFALWIYVFGDFVGTVVALPLTQFIMVYLDHYISRPQEQNEVSVGSSLDT